jgi:hypothetical protein
MRRPALGMLWAGLAVLYLLRTLENRYPVLRRKR